MIEFLSDIDTQLLLFFNGIHSPFWDYFMSAFTGKVIWVPMYASILYILLKLPHKSITKISKYLNALRNINLFPLLLLLLNIRL